MILILYVAIRKNLKSHDIAASILFEAVGRTDNMHLVCESIPTVGTAVTG